MKVFGSCTTE